MNVLSEIGHRNSAEAAERAGRIRRPHVLTSWKEVARYMGKGVRTVQRWERDFSLPVRRPSGAKNKRVILVFTADLDAWIAAQCSRMQRDSRTDGNGLSSATLRDCIRASAELRVANRLLLNEIQIAVEALLQTLSDMCPQSAFVGLAPPRRIAGRNHAGLAN
jgi:transcriptional regulator with XRE-family HTH domain